MGLYSLVIDDFLDEPDLVRNYCLKQEFREERSPVDNLLYKGVAKQVPLWLELEMMTKLSTYLSSPVVPFLSFFRLSLKNLATRWVHTDVLYSRYVAVVYLNKKFPKQAGTRFFSHPKLDVLHGKKLDLKACKLWDKIANKPREWDVAGEVPMRFNRMTVYDTSLFHAPLPKDGFGKGVKDGRLVYVMFFNVR